MSSVKRLVTGGGDALLKIWRYALYSSVLPIAKFVLCRKLVYYSCVVCVRCEVWVVC